MSLASSLGVLGGSLLAAQGAKEDRREKLGTAEADRVFQVLKAEDIQKLKTLDILGQSGKFDIKDNPYAVARIDELRGQYLNSLYKNKYETEILPNSPLPKNSQENIKNYEDFKVNSLKEDEVNVENTTAFNKGFYGSHPLDLLDADNVYRKRRQADKEGERNAVILSKADDILAGSLGKDPKTLAGELQELSNSAMLSQMPVASRIKLAEGIAKKLAENGDTAQIEAYGDTISYFNAETEEPVKVRDIIALNTYNDLANVENVRHNDNKTRQFLSEIEKIPSSAIAAHIDSYKEKDPSFWKVISTKSDSLIKTQKAKEERVQKELLAKTVTTANNSIKQNRLDSILTAHLAGMTVDSTGRLITDNKYIGADGKEHTLTDADWTNKLQQVFIDNIKNYPPAEAAERNLTVLTAPGAKGFVNSLRTNLVYTLGSLSPNQLRQDANGGSVLPEGLDNMVSLYRSNPASFYQVFEGNDASPGQDVADLKTLVTLIDTNGLQEGVTKFAAGRELRRDPNYKAYVKETIEDHMTFEDTSFQIKELGSSSYCAVGALNSPALFDAYEKNLESDLYCQIDINTATRSSLKNCQDTFVSYKGSAIPRGFFNSIASTNQEVVAAQFIEEMKRRVAGDDSTPDSVHVVYQPGSNVLLFTNPSNPKKHQALSSQEFTTLAHKYLESLPPERRVLVEDVLTSTEDVETDLFEEQVSTMVD